MNKKVYNIILSYAKKPNDKETRAAMARELGAELLSSAPTFHGTIVDRTSLTEEKMGKLNFKILYNDQEYNLNEFKTLTGI